MYKTVVPDDDALLEGDEKRMEGRGRSQGGSLLLLRFSLLLFPSSLSFFSFLLLPFVFAAADRIRKCFHSNVSVSYDFVVLIEGPE